MATVTLSNRKSFAAEPGKSLLDSAKAQGIVLEYSCRTGRCGVCKARLLSGETEVLQEQLELTDSEISAGYILTCCQGAVSDVELDIEDLGALADLQIKTMPCRLDSIEKVAADVVHVVLRTPPRSALFYLAGQYVDVIGKEGVRRSYSVANAPREDGKLDLYIRQVPDGAMSQYWFEHAQANDLLRLEGPLGTFSLRSTPAKNLVFLATGTGIAPVKAMLEALSANPDQAAGKQIHVYWGGRIESDIYWRPDFSHLDLTFTPVLSRAGDLWAGRTGHVQQVLLDDGIAMSDAVVYACGSETMIHSARDVLIGAGLPTKNFYSDAFVSSN